MKTKQILKKIPFAKFVDKTIKRIRTHSPIDVQGNKMYLDLNDSMALRKNGVYEAYETKTIKDIVNDGDVVLDIGANIGYHTLILSELVGEKGKVYAFEPDSENFEILKKNVEINKCKNVILVNKAVSDKTGKSKLYLSTNPLDHRTYKSSDNNGIIEIESISLDDYFREYNGTIDFIKMDIQGAEHHALIGMEQLLTKNKNIKMICEFWPHGLSKAGVDPKTFFYSIIILDFKIREISEKFQTIFSLFNPYLLNVKYTQENKKYTNILIER